MRYNEVWDIWIVKIKNYGCVWWSMVIIMQFYSPTVLLHHITPSLQKSHPGLMFVMTLIWIKRNLLTYFHASVFEHFKNAPMSVFSALGSLSAPCGPPFSFFFHLHNYITAKFLPFLSRRIENTFYFDQENHILSYKYDQQTISLSGMTLRLEDCFHSVVCCHGNCAICRIKKSARCRYWVS